MTLLEPEHAVRRSYLWAALLSLIALPLIAHLEFSSLGFNPTDDGFILAYSRRLLDGQIPHRDFISIRPIGSALLHAPWLLIGGAHTFWLARLAVWFEFALIAWGWTRLVGRMTGRPSRSSDILLGTLVCFVMTSFTFPVMPWHTVDALALASGGLLLASSPAGWRKTLGYFLLGASALCRQNFVPVAPLAALILGDRRNRHAGLAAISPIILYGVFLLVTGALGPALLQMRSHAVLEEAGVRAYFSSVWGAVGLMLGVLCALLTETRAGHDRDAASEPWALLAPAITWGLLLGAACTMMSNNSPYIQHASFALLGATLGQTVVLMVRRGWRDPAVRVGWLALLVAWCASISIGLSSPVLAAGALAAQLLGPTWAGEAPRVARPRLRIAMAIGIAAAFVAVWATSRLNVIYRDGPSTELTQPLGPVLPGGAGLRTNPQTFALMADLDHAVSKAHDRTYAIVADFPGYWAKAGQRDPLSIDWPQSTELNSPELKARVIADLERMRGSGRILVQKVYAERAAERLDPIEDDSYYFIPLYVRKHFRRTGGTRWFDIYE